MKIGFAGFCQTLFDRKITGKFVHDLFKYLIDKYDKFEVVSGLTNQGILSLVYAEGTYRDLFLTGIACSKANDEDCDKFPVDKEIIVGDSWGDESETFLDYIDMFIRIGGGSQTISEEKRAREKGIPILSFDVDQVFSLEDIKK